MDRVHVIRHKVLVEERPIRAVARELGVSRNTVRKYLEQAEPVRQAAQARPRPVFEQVQPRIEALLEEWGPRTTPKQRITASRLHRELVEEGYAVGRTTVQAILHEHRRQRAEVYVPLVHRPGDEAQVDFFEVTVELEGQRRKAWKFVMRLMYSGRDFAWLYDRCDQVAFLDGHVRAFAHFGSIPQRIVYDNLSSAVRKVVYPRRELTARFQALVNHYLFEPCFARPGEGHDKGGVESRGKGIRLQHLTPVPRGASLGVIASGLLEALDREATRKRDAEGRSVVERFEAERALMLPLPARPFEARKVVPCSVSRSAKVKVEGATYSVPCHWKRLDATAYVGPEDVRIVCRGESEVHARQRFGGQSIRYRHYLPELARKPQAVRQVAPELLAELSEPYRALWRLLVDRHGPANAARVFARVLEAVCARGEAAVGQALRTALDAGRVGWLPLPRAPRGRGDIAVPEALRGYDIAAASAAGYDALLSEARHD